MINDLQSMPIIIIDYVDSNPSNDSMRIIYTNWGGPLKRYFLINCP